MALPGITDIADGSDYGEGDFVSLANHAAARVDLLDKAISESAQFYLNAAKSRVKKINAIIGVHEDALASGSSGVQSIPAHDATISAVDIPAPAIFVSPPVAPAPIPSPTPTPAPSPFPGPITIDPPHGPPIVLPPPTPPPPICDAIDCGPPPTSCPPGSHAHLDLNTGTWRCVPDDDTFGNCSNSDGGKGTIPPSLFLGPIPPLPLLGPKGKGNSDDSVCCQIHFDTTFQSCYTIELATFNPYWITVCCITPGTMKICCYQGSKPPDVAIGVVVTGPWPDCSHGMEAIQQWFAQCQQPGPSPVPPKVCDKGKPPDCPDCHNPVWDDVKCVWNCVKVECQPWQECYKDGCDGLWKCRDQPCPDKYELEDSPDVCGKKCVRVSPDDAIDHTAEFDYTLQWRGLFCDAVKPSSTCPAV